MCSSLISARSFSILDGTNNVQKQLELKKHPLTNINEQNTRNTNSIQKKIEQKQFVGSKNDKTIMSSVWKKSKEYQKLEHWKRKNDWSQIPSKLLKHLRISIINIQLIQSSQLPPKLMQIINTFDFMSHDPIINFISTEEFYNSLSP